ncbi:MAG: hypothetical protein ABEJ65_03780 [bacterium]
MNNPLKNLHQKSNEIFLWASFILFATGLLKFWWFFRTSPALAWFIAFWAILTVTCEFYRSTHLPTSMVFLGTLLWKLDSLLRFITTQTAIAKNDTHTYIKEALHVQDMGGVLSFIGHLYLGQWPFFNRTPLVSLLVYAVKVPDLSWFVTGKMISLLSWVVMICGLHFFTKRWFRRSTALITVLFVLFFFPVLHTHVGLIGADLAVTGIVLFGLGLVYHQKRAFVTRHAMLSGVVLGLGYWAKANALLTLPVVLLYFFVRCSTWKQTLKLSAIFLGMWIIVTSPILVNNALNHGNPFYNYNKKFMLAKRHVSGDNLDKPGSLPKVQGFYNMASYLGEGFWACLYGFWIFTELPAFFTTLFVALAIIGVLYWPLRNPDYLSILLFVLLVFLSQALHMEIHARYVFMGWTVLIAVGTSTLNELGRTIIDHEDRVYNILNKKIPGETIGIVFFFASLALLGATLTFLPSQPEYRDVLNSYEPPDGWNSLVEAVNNLEIPRNEPVIYGPSHTHPIVYAGFRYPKDLPYIKNREKMIDWIDSNDIHWFILSREALGRREVFWGKWFRWKNQPIRTRPSFEHAPFTLKYQHPDIIILKFTKNKTKSTE